MLLDKFFDKYYESLKEKKLNKVIVAPVSMTRENTEDDEGWIEWQPADAIYTIDSVHKFENDYKIKFPKEYVEYIVNRQFFDIEIGGYRIYGINEFKSLEDIAKLFPQAILSLGFYPIGDINDGDYIAINTHSGQIVELKYEDYSLVRLLFDNFNNLIDELSSSIK